VRNRLAAWHWRHGARSIGHATFGSAETSRSKSCRLGVARDADRLNRFRHEAKSLAAVNHPNIVTVFSVEEATTDASPDSVHFLTMQLVQGNRSIVEQLMDGLRKAGLDVSDARARPDRPDTRTLTSDPSGA
jgi:hypothetical protein